MTSDISKGRLWTGRVMSAIAVLFMLMDSVAKLFKDDNVVKGTLDVGFAEHHIVALGILGLISTVLYAVPRTSVLGAILLTGYFGGVIATHMRLDNPLFSHILFPIYLAILVWGGLWLRDSRVGRLLLGRRAEH